MALNNLVFTDSFPFSEVPDKDMFKALSENFSSDNENTVIALLNILCRLMSKSDSFKNYLKKTVFAEFKTKIDTLKYHKNTTVQKLVEDIYLLLDK